MCEKCTVTRTLVAQYAILNNDFNGHQFDCCNSKVVESLYVECASGIRIFLLPDQLSK